MKTKFKIGSMVKANFKEDLPPPTSFGPDIFDSNKSYYGTIIEIIPFSKYPYMVQTVIGEKIYKTPFKEEELTLREDPNDLLKKLI